MFEQHSLDLNSARQKIFKSEVCFTPFELESEGCYVAKHPQNVIKPRKIANNEGFRAEQIQNLCFLATNSQSNGHF